MNGTVTIQFTKHNHEGTVVTQHILEQDVKEVVLFYTALGLVRMTFEPNVPEPIPCQYPRPPREFRFASPTPEPAVSSEVPTPTQTANTITARPAKKKAKRTHAVTPNVNSNVRRAAEHKKVDEDIYNVGCGGKVDSKDPVR